MKTMLQPTASVVQAIGSVVDKRESKKKGKFGWENDRDDGVGFNVSWPLLSWEYYVSVLSPQPHLFCLLKENIL